MLCITLQSRTSLQDIAEKLSINRSTVSRALRNDPRIAVRTKEQVRLACEELEYRPNSIISELATSRWKAGKAAKGSVIAYIIRTRAGSDIGANPGVNPSLESQAARLGYQLQVFRRSDFERPAKLERLLHSRGITDVILGPVFEEALTIEMDWSKFNCVQLLPGFYSLPLHSVVRDHFNAVVMAWQKAVSRGYRRIGLVLMEHPQPVIDDIVRASAAHACQTRIFRHLPKIEPFRMFFKNYRIKAFAKWMRANKPDVLIEFSKWQSHAVRAKFAHETALVSLHAVPAEGGCGILYDIDVCAKEAVNLLHFCRNTYQWGLPDWRIDHVVEPKWVEGDSLPVVRTASTSGDFEDPFAVD